jgi:hypothetical protein
LVASASPCFLGGFLIFVWSAPHFVVRIHYNHNPPTIVIIASNADLDGVLLHVGFIQVQFGPAGGVATRVGANLQGQHGRI